MNCSFFLGVSGQEGFCSFYDELIDLKSARVVYIIKGGPGGGKSSFMKRVAEKSAVSCECIRCSSDPNSLDAVIMESLQTAVVDGTAPHCIEPRYPFAVERYLDFGAFVNADALYAKKDKIIDAIDRYNGYRARIARYIACAGRLSAEIFDSVIDGVDMEKLRRRGASLARRELDRALVSGEDARVRKRFLSAITPDGFVTLGETVEQLAERIVAMRDSFGLAHFALLQIREELIARKIGFYECRSPIDTEKIEHIIVPSARLAFVTQNRRMEFENYTRRVRLDAMIDENLLYARKRKLAFSRELSDSVIDECVALLREAKTAHDEIERLYNPYIDFKSIYALADGLIKRD